MCCISTIKTIASERKLARANYETIYKLRLKWTIEDLHKLLVKLNNKLHSLKGKEKNILDEIDKLKQEKFLSYHINKSLRAMYRKPKPFRGKPIPPFTIIWYLQEPLRFYFVHGLAPITAPLAIAQAITTWLYAEKNDDKITEKDFTKNTTLEDIKKAQQNVDNEITVTKKKITEVDIESKELKGLEHFISTY